MSTIGKLNKIVKDGQNQIIGNISTLEMNLKFKLSENKNKSSDNAPDYLIVTANSNGDEAQVGSVWIKVIDKLGEEIKEFFSMTFDDPSFPHSLNVAAFPQGEAYWDIVWRRRQTT
jgi:uncharacterized protein (DUF736 family)